jgi:hypothetical protein
MSTQKDKLYFLASFHKVSDEIFSTNDHRIKQFKCPKTALKIFLRDYAFEKSGAALAYKFMAEEIISNIEIDFTNLTDDMIKNVWDKFKSLKPANSNINENGKSNPLCYDIYERSSPDKKGKYKYIKSNSKFNYEKTVLGIMRKYNIKNIANDIKVIIEENNIVKAHKILREIRGVDNKIASLFLRDLVYNSKIGLSSKENQHYLQPVDTWIAQAYKIIFDTNIDLKKVTEKIRGDIQKKISVIDEVSPINFNKGAWYFGSQIAKTYKRLNDSLNDSEIAKKYIGEHLETCQKEINALNNLLKI